LLDSDAEIEPQTLMPLVMTAEENPDMAVVGSAVSRERTTVRALSKNQMF